MLHRYRVVLWLVSTALLWLIGCSGGKDRDQSGSEHTGKVSAALEFEGSTHDIEFVEYKVVAAAGACDDQPIATKTVNLESEPLPGNLSPDGSGLHVFSDAFFVLEPGEYKVCATPLQGNGEPSAECAMAMTLATVFAESTTEVVLVSECNGNPTGAVDVILTLNDPPRIDDLDLSPSKFIKVCESVSISVSASDPNGDELSYEWEVVTAPPGSSPDVDENGPQAIFSTDLPGDYEVKVTVTDPFGRQASLTFPIHVSDAECMQCDPSNEFCDAETVNVDIGLDGLRLSDSGTCGFVWVAVSTKGTIAKIDIETGEVVGEFRTHPTLLGSAADPSRTTVDADCSVWVANRQGDPGSVTHVGAVENGQCEDRNGNGVIDTSTGLNDIRGWTTLLAPHPRGVGDAEDECIVHHTQVNSEGTRHISVDRNNDIWVSGTAGIGGRDFQLIKGGRFDVPGSGTILRTELSVGFGGYGGLVDGNNVIWSTTSGPLFRWDTTQPLAGPNGNPPGLDIGPPIGSSWAASSDYGNGYGLCIGPDENVWMTTLGNGLVHRFAPDGASLGSFAQGNGLAQGCAVDDNGHVWVAHSFLGPITVGHLDENGMLLGNVTVGNGPTGVAVDRNGNVWATNYNSRTVSRINPLLNAPVGQEDLVTVDLGGNPYNYSDMTGRQNAATPTTGTSVFVVDSLLAGAQWIGLSWVETVPGDAMVVFEARSSEDQMSWGPWVVATNGNPPGVGPGRYIQIRITLNRSSGGDSPVVQSATVTWASP